MKQHLTIFALNEPMFCKEYLCPCNACLRFSFKECSGDDIPVYAELPCNDYFGEDEEIDAIDKKEQIFDFLDVPLFLSLFSGNQNYERFLKGFYLKLSRLKHNSKKKLQLLPTPIAFTPDEVFEFLIPT